MATNILDQNWAITLLAHTRRCDKCTSGEGELIREAIETIQPTLYTAKDSRVEVQQLASSSTLNLLV